VTSSDVNVDVSGDMVEAWAETYVDLNVSGDIIGNISITSSNSGDAATHYGDVDSYAYASSDADAYSEAYGNSAFAWSYTEANLDVGGDISGDITIGSSNAGDATSTYGEVSSCADSDHFTSYVYSYAYGNTVETSAYTDVEIDVAGGVEGDINITANNSGTVDISSSDVATGYAYAYTYADIYIGENLIGNISSDAINTGDAVVQLSSDWSYAEVYAEISSDIHVAGDVSGDITFTALNEGNAFAGNVSDNSYATSITNAANYSSVSVSGDFTGDVTLTSNNKGDVTNFGGVNVITAAIVQSDIYVDDLVDANIDVSANNEGTEGFALAGLLFTGGSGDIHTVNLDAADVTNDDSGWAAVYFGLNQNSTAFDGGIGEMNVSVGDTAYVSADINLEEYIDTLNIEADDDTGDSRIDIFVNQNTHGGDVYVNNFGNTDTTFRLTYEDETADNIYLGSYLNNNVLTAGDFDQGSVLNLELNMNDQDLDLDNFTDYNQLIDNMLTIYGGIQYDVDDFNFELYFDDTTDLNSVFNSGGYTNGGSFGNINQFLDAADGSLNGTVDYYFGVVNGDGYLAYDQDGAGFTMLIQFDDLTAFSSSLINNVAA